MKVLSDREKLRDALAIANSVVPARSPKPAVENLCVVATDDCLELIGTDMEVSLRYRVRDVKVAEPGITAIPARVALEFVRDLTGDTVSIGLEGDKCVIQSGSDRCQLVTLDPDEFPATPRFDEEKVLKIQGGTFSRLVSRTSFATAREAGRYAMHGLMTECKDGQLHMVGTDGRRMALASVPVEDETFVSAPAIVPTKSMQLFSRVISDPLDMIELSFRENQICMRTKDAEVFARLIEGEFPRYSAVIPKECKNHIEAETETLARKLRLVSNVTGDDARAVRMAFRTDELEITGHSSGRGEARAQLQVTFPGKEAEIAFNPDYVLEGLKNAEGPQVKLEFEEKTSPGKFTLGENYVYVVMPITIDT